MHLGWELGGWLGGLGARGSPGWEGSLRRSTRAAGGARGGRARNPKDFISWDFKALKLKVLRLEGLKD